MSKILIIHHSGLIGGAGVSLISVIKALAPSHEITVFVSDSPDDIIRQLKLVSKQIPIQIECYGSRIGALTYYSGGDRVSSPRFMYRAMLIAKQWRYWNKLIGKVNPDLVIVNSIILSWMSLLPELRSRKSICFVRETISGPLNTMVNKLHRKFLSRFSRVAFITEFDRKSWDFPVAKSVVIPNFYDELSLDNTINRDIASKRLGLRDASFHVLYVGGVSHMKGFDLIVKAVLEMNEDVDTELIVAGINFEDRVKMGGGKLNDYERGIQNYIKCHCFADKIHIIGRQLNMSESYASADVLVFPMRSPHQARPVFEAGHYSIPVIISDFPHIKETVLDNENGLRFQPDNVEDLKSCLKKLALNQALRIKIGLRNNELAQKYHSKKANTILIKKFISETI